MLQTMSFLQQGQHAVGSCQLTILAACVHAAHVLVAVNQHVAAGQQVFCVRRLQTASMLQKDSV